MCLNMHTYSLVLQLPSSSSSFLFMKYGLDNKALDPELVEFSDRP